MFLPNLIQALYKSAFQPFLFGLEAETAHELAVGSLAQLEYFPLALNLLEPFLRVEDDRLNVSIRSLTCANPVGLAAGFDKNAELLNVLPRLGFGFIEVGTFTPLKQSGQPKPRLFRYKKDQAIVNRMGFNNPGVKAAAERIAARKPKRTNAPVGANIGKGKETPIEEAVEDYLTGLEHVQPVADYIVLNVSSPNTPNLRKLQSFAYLENILKCVSQRNRELAEKMGQPPKPLFTKVSPDCTEEELEAIAHLSVELNTGLVATNTTIDKTVLKKAGKKKEDGGISGAPLREKSNAVLKKLRSLTKGVVPIIGVGGIFTAEDAYEKIRLGASLIQVYTGWIYKGPGLVPEINAGLLELMEADGFKNIQEAVGTL